MRAVLQLVDDGRPAAAGPCPPGVGPTEGPASGVEGFGYYLRREREVRSVPLATVAARTRVPLRSLERLEAGDLERLPAEVFVRGFVRAYSRCLGLDEREVMRRYERALACAAPPPPAAEPEPAEEPTRRRVPLALLVLILIVLATLTLSLLLMRPAPTAGRLSSAPAAAASDRLDS